MSATATIGASLALAVPAPEGTANEIRQLLVGDSTLAALTNTIAQIAFTVTDAITGDDQTVELQLMAPPQSVTADASTDKITLAAHGYAAGQAVQITGTALPAPLVAGTTYYVRDVATNDFKVASSVGGTAINLTTAGTAVKVRPFGGITLTYPYHQPGTPVQVREQVTGELNDFTAVRAVQVIFRAADTGANASGRAQLTMGDTTDRYGHFSVPLKLAYTAAGEQTWPSWLAALPQGLDYDTAYHLTLRIAAGDSNANGLILINLLGN